MIVFDIDGTILPGASCERRFVPYLIRRKILRPWHFINFCIRAVALARFGLPYITKANKGYLRGFGCSTMAEIGREFFAREIIPAISKDAIARIEEHKSRGQRIIFLSGMPDFLLENFARFLGVTEYYGSVMEHRNERFTGRTLGPFPLAWGKVAALERIIAGDAAPVPGDYNLLPKSSHFNRQPAWPDVTFYGDHWLDRHLFFKVGRAVVVNGGEKLLQLAKQNGWERETF